MGSHGASFKIGELNGMVFGGGFGDWGADGDDFGGGSCGMTSVSTQVLFVVVVVVFVPFFWGGRDNLVAGWMSCRRC